MPCASNPQPYTLNYIGIMKKWKLPYNILGLYGDNGKENGHYYIMYWGYMGIMEKQLETTIV